MTPAHRRILLFVVGVLVAVGLVAAAVVGRHQATPAANNRPKLLLLTSLPLMFGEGFSLDGGGSPALSALRQAYDVVPISATDADALGKGRLLLMAHPLAQTAENLVELDEWVRRGGRVVLLADPMLEWPSERPLGDPLRPPAMFMDTGLLAHWGLRLDPPLKRGPAAGKIGGRDVVTLSPGRLSGQCAIAPGGLSADCRIGRGRAVVIADADFLNVGPGDGGEDNLPALLSELAIADS